MKITGFNPLILTKDAGPVIALFEALGFERRHSNSEIEDQKVDVGVRMSDANGFHVDIVQTDMFPQDRMTIRMNTDDMDEAYKTLVAHGFKSRTNEPVNSKGSKSYGMISPSGYWISLVKHVKEKD